MILQFLTIFMTVIGPVFGVILIGYVLGPRLKLEAQTLSRLAYTLFVPAYVFNTISKADLAFYLAAKSILYMTIVTCLSAMAGWAIACGLKRSNEIKGAYILIGAFGNVGNFGIAIIGFRLGDPALVCATLYFVTVNVIAIIISISYANWIQHGGISAVRHVFKSPVILALFPALFFPVFNIPVPLVLSRMMILLAAAMIPTMLVALGIYLSKSEGLKLDTDVLVASGVKLIVGPVLAVLLAVPLGVAGLERSAGILQAGMPVAVVAYFIAMEYHLAPKLMVAALFFSTLCSFFTLTVLLSIV